MEPYKYEPLPSASHIRLLEWCPPAEDGTLCFRLITQDLNDTDAPPYLCLSYTWGNPFAHGNGFQDEFAAAEPYYGESNKASVHVNGKTLAIQRNLHEALEAAIRHSHKEYVSRPLDGTKGRRYIHIAAGRGRHENIRLWLKQCADINIADDEGYTALHYAAGNNQLECVKVLIENGCRLDHVNFQGQTALDIAKADGHDAVVALLENHNTVPRIPTEQLDIVPRIWADAICINQEDMAEKGTQVTVMDRIYSSALYVVAWLGPQDSYSNAGLNTLGTLCKHAKQFQDSTIEPFSSKNKESYTDAGIPVLSAEDWKALVGVFQRQWFRRAWIVQEAVLNEALLVYLGNQCIEWRQLGQVAEAIRYQEAKLGTKGSSQFVPSGDVDVSVMWNMAEVAKWRQSRAAMHDGGERERQGRELFTMRHVVYNFWTFLATDPRDKVFAHYGLLNSFSPDRRVTDYGLTIPQVFTKATRELIESEGSLRTLACCVYVNKRRKDLPSWVPDYSLPGFNAVPDKYKADKGLQYRSPPPAKDPADLSLCVQGVFIGRISQVGGRKGTNDAEKLMFDQSWLTLPLSLCGKGGYGDKMYISSILWTTLCMGMSSGSLFHSEKYGDEAPDEQGVQFRYFLIFLILAEADSMIRVKLGLEPRTTKHDINFSHLDYDPMAEDMEPILAQLDAFAEHDGAEACWTPSRAEVLKFWNDFRCGLMRCTEVDSDSGPTDFYLPAGVTMDNSRPFGNGYALPTSRLLRRCQGFMSAYQSMYGGRQLMTINGDRYLGLGSLSARPEDQVWILPGLNAPVILRPSGPGASFQFLGACYLHGMMDGDMAIKSAAEDIILV